jgi:hypothetical protein
MLIKIFLLFRIDLIYDVEGDADTFFIPDHLDAGVINTNFYLWKEEIVIKLRLNRMLSSN